MIATWLSWGAAVFGVLAAWLWYRASIVSVPAPEGTHGVGALMGGYLISMSNGIRIDLHATLDQQSKLNARAAANACAGAACTAVTWMADVFSWP